MNYSGLNAKISAMRGKLLKPADLSALCAEKTTDGVLQTLSGYEGYSRFHKSESLADIKHSELEYGVTASLFDNFYRISKYIGDVRVKMCLESVFLKYEINIIKGLLSAVYDERESVYTIPELKLFLGDNLNIDRERVLSSTTVGGFIENLSGSLFYPVLKRAYDKSPSMFELMMALDLFYFMQLNKTVRMFDRNNRKVLKIIIGTETDVTNICWAIRLRENFRMEPKEIYTYLIPLRYRLQSETLMRIAEAKNREDIYAEIMKCPYGVYFERAKGSLERFHFIAMSHAYGAVNNMTNTLAKTFSYLFYKETEVNNLISLAEGVSYGLSASEIMEFILP